MLTIAKLHTIRRMLLTLVAMIEAELQARGVPLQERTITVRDYQQH